MLAWLLGKLADLIIGKNYGPEWLNTGTHLYAVPVCRTGRIIEVVRVRADSEEEAGLKAVRYLRAGLYPHKIVRQKEPSEQQG